MVGGSSPCTVYPVSGQMVGGAAAGGCCDWRISLSCSKTSGNHGAEGGDSYGDGDGWRLGLGPGPRLTSGNHVGEGGES